MTPLKFATPADPDLSVVVVTWNAWEWTARALAALREHTDAAFETIVVDNLSTDETPARLGELQGVRVVRNTANRGFGAAACQGALLARAPRLLFLNSDALVEPGWWPPLVAALDGGGPDVAAVTPRLLHPDGRLQEAGSMVWGEGACDNYGDGDDPARPEYLFSRDVDYASAACLLVRREAFVDAGGFDDAYHPAYYEDTDLAMRWRSMGLRVVYEPASTAVHRRWASSGDRSGMLGLLLRNRATFFERWADEIGDRPPRPQAPSRADFTAIRDAGCGERLLVVDRGPGHEPGLASRIAEAVAASTPHWRVTLVLAAGGPGGAEVERLRARGVEVVPLGPDGLMPFLDDRPRHYTVALLGSPVAVPAADSVRRTQGTITMIGIADSPGGPEADWGRSVRGLVCGMADRHEGPQPPRHPILAWDGTASSLRTLFSQVGVQTGLAARR